VRLIWSAEGAIAEALEAHGGYVAAEVLAVSFSRAALAGSDAHEVDVDGEKLLFRLEKETVG
jgi:hypothetical protein